MTNLWEFLLQTMEVSWAALFLLILKHLLADKLSPRWQYGIWGLFFVKLLVPAGVTGKYLLAFPAVMLQTVREAAESVLSSRFCTADAPIRVAFGLPWFPGNPQSLTDWLFILYLAGAVVCLGRYFFSYVCLRLLLRSGKSVSAEFQTRMDALCSRYHLKACRTVLLPDLPSAFICGVCSPVLALPSEEVDDKILLHELLHLRSMDALQSIFWSIFRSIHWCNPFLQYVFHRIGNDMESLCDQRVLERLEGEERRRYGEILLNMTNDRYPRAPGTTSLSNGGRNIRSRIRAIARFRKYPQGMGLVHPLLRLWFRFSSGPDGRKGRSDWHLFQNIPVYPAGSAAGKFSVRHHDHRNIELRAIFFSRTGYGCSVCLRLLCTDLFMDRKRRRRRRLFPGRIVRHISI